MKLQILILLFLNFIRIKASEQPTTENAESSTSSYSSENEQYFPMYPHNVGIRNHRYNCYMNALFSCLYTIPFFHNTVYELINELPEYPPKSESILLSLGDIFAKMRLNKSPVGIAATMFHAIKRELDWNVGEYRCVLEFWTNFIDKMPETFQNICKVQMKSNFLRKSDGLLIKSVDLIVNYIDIPTPKKPIVLSEFVASNFLDNETENFVIEPDCQCEYPHIITEPITKNVEIPMFNTMTIENSPNVIIFNIKRLGWDKESSGKFLNTVPVMYDDFKINNETYSPLCAVVYREEDEHYFAIVYDKIVGQFFIHNDTQVVEMDSNDPNSLKKLENYMAKSSTMLFYAKDSAYESFDSEMSEIILENLDIPQVLKDTVKAPNLKKRPVENPLKNKTKRARNEEGAESKNSEDSETSESSENFEGSDSETKVEVDACL